jgi:hypothetical protein
MGYTTKDIDKIASLESLTEAEKIDELLRIDCFMYTNLGTDSTQAERDEVEKTSNRIYQIINSIDEEVGSLLVMGIDKK